MKNFKQVAVGVIGFVSLFTPLAFASALSLSIDSLSPGTTAPAKTDVTFKVTATPFGQVTYIVSDSFSGTTISANNINAAGNFSWLPTVRDVGTHTISIHATSYTNGDAEMADITQTITVAPPPSISIQSVSPSAKVSAGTKFSFTVVPSGFTNPTYSLSDSFSGSTVGNVALSSAGNFEWTPSSQDDGEHTISVYASDSLGHNAVATVNMVVGVGRVLTITSVNPSNSVSPGQSVQFMTVPMNYAPNAFTVVDNFPGGVSSISNSNINSSGSFVWTPGPDQVGTHFLTIQGTVGVFGNSATTSQTLFVLGPNGTVPLLPAATAAPVVVGTPSTSAAPSASALSALQDQLALLNAKIAAQKTTASAAPLAASTVSSGSFNTYLYQGMEGDEVLHLQNVLKAQGFFSAEPNGHFGPITVAAVMKFQESKGLTQLGVVGPATRVALNALGSVAGASIGPDTSDTPSSYVFENFIKWGDRGTDVSELQKRLIKLGFLESDSVTGYFGAGTYAALIKFQTANGLDAKGYVGPGTRAALNK